VCFSKGLGAPVGSALCGPKEFITKARRVRKLFGGGMRQAGLLAAAALHALDHHIERLAEDHANAQRIADAIRDCPSLRLVPERVETNLIWFEAPNATELARGLKEDSILIQVAGPTLLRACLHLDVSATQAATVAESIRRRYGRQKASA
jgi:threonine aldolase